MQRDFARAILAMVLGLGVLAGLLRAEPPPGTVPSSLATAQLLQPVPVAEQSAGTTTEGGCEGGHAAAVKSGGHPLRDCLHNLGICCWAHHNTLGCGSLKSECNFIFGSCRTFYGEPCFKGPPPSPFPPGYGYGPTGCNCP